MSGVAKETGSADFCLLDHQVAVEQVLVHRHVDDARMRDLVGALALESGVGDGGLDDVPVRFVEVERATRLVGIATEAFEDHGLRLPGRISDVTAATASENNQRGFYTRWQQFMEAKSWADLKR